jgi:CHASE3 domain sensor protein
MLWTWVLVCLLVGELLLYFILSSTKKVFPYEITSPVKSRVFFYTLCLGIFVMGGISFFSYRDTQERLRQLDLINDRFLAIAEVENEILQMESSQRGFLITGRKTYLAPYAKQKKTIHEKCEAVQKLYHGTVDQRRVEELCTLLNDRLITLEKNIELKETGKKEALEQALLLNEGKNTMEILIMTGRDLEDREIATYRRIMSGLWTLGSVRVYMSFMLMVFALIQIGLAAALGRSKELILGQVLVNSLKDQEKK